MAGGRLTIKNKVVHITSVHDPFDVRIFYKECKSLRKAGYDVVLVAAGERFTNVEGITIKTVPKAYNRFTRIVRTSWMLYKKALKEEAAIYHIHDPELILIGLLIRLSGTKVIYDVHEDVPKQILGKSWIWCPFRTTISNIFNLVEKAASKHFDAIVTATSSIAERFYEINKNVVVVKNFPVCDEFNCITPNDNNYLKRSNCIVYIGGITEIRGLREIIKAIGLVDSSYSHKLILGGKFENDTFEKEITSLEEWSLVDFKGWLNRDQVAEVLQRSRAGLVLLYPAANYLESLPVKMFEYMAAGLPVIASNFPYWKEIVNGNQCGLTVDPKDPVAIASAIKYIFDHPEEAEAMGQRGREAVLQKYNWKNEEKKLLKLYAKLL